MMNKKISILAAEYPIENIALRAFIIASIVLVAIYIYFVGTSILDIIARKEALAESAKIATVIADFERDYFSLSKNVTARSAGTAGLVPVNDIAYVYRPGAVGQADARNKGI